MGASVNISVSAIGGAVATITAGLIDKASPGFLNPEMQGSLQTIFVSLIIGLSYLGSLLVRILMKKYGLSQEGTGNGENPPPAPGQQ